VGAAAVKPEAAQPVCGKIQHAVCIAVGFIDRKAGFAQFTQERIEDPAVLSSHRKFVTSSIRTTSTRHYSATCRPR